MNVARLYPLQPNDPKHRCGKKTRQGGMCNNPPIRGGRVCRMHGGSAPQVKMAAAERLAAMVDPALTELAELVKLADSDAIKLAAIKDVLDRAGFSPKQRIEQTGKMVIEVVYGDEGAGLLETPALGPASDQG